VSELEYDLVSVIQGLMILASKIFHYAATFSGAPIGVAKSTVIVDGYHSARTQPRFYALELTQMVFGTFSVVLPFYVPAVKIKQIDTAKIFSLL
jgi:hypothetical protein